MFRKVLGLNLKVNSYRLMINLETEIIIICPLGGEIVSKRVPMRICKKMFLGIDVDN